MKCQPYFLGEKYVSKCLLIFHPDSKCYLVKSEFCNDFSLETGSHLFSEKKMANK